MEKFLIIDGYAFIFRSFYAIKHNLTTSTGIPTNAIYGFVQLLIRIKERVRPKYLLVVFDSGKGSFRDEIYKDYKANRTITPPTLIPQFNIAREALDAMDIPFVSLEGFEADDLIATYVKIAKETNYITDIMSFDKDLMQLIDDGFVEMYDESKNVYINTKDVIKKFGIRPSQIADYLALVGDSSDNIPGVAGIGPKNAISLIQTFGDADSIYKNIGIVNSIVLREKLLKGHEMYLLSKKLVALCNDVPVESKNINSFSLTSFNFDKFIPFLKKYELNNILNSISKNYYLDIEEKLKKSENKSSFLTQGDLF